MDWSFEHIETFDEGSSSLKFQSQVKFISRRSLKIFLLHDVLENREDKIYEFREFTGKHIIVWLLKYLNM